MLFKKSKIILLVVFLLMFLSLHIFFTPFTLVMAGNDSACTNSPNHPTSPGLGGTCQWGLRDATTCKVGTTPGTVVPNKCFSNPSSDYRCCVPDEKERVYTDDTCSRIGGVCITAPRGANVCSSSFGSGCLIGAVCRTKEGVLMEESYRCCLPADSEWCTDRLVRYEKWPDLIANGDCPFSKGLLAQEYIHCSQGPYNTGCDANNNCGSHANTNAVDIRHIRETERKGVVWEDGADQGSVYFITPERGWITYSNKIGYCIVDTGVERLEIPNGGTLKFQTASGIEYTIIHAFALAPIEGYYGDSGHPRVGVGKGLEVEKGVVIAKIALPTDSQVITFKDNPCASGAHFHVEVKGIDKCADCHFIDDLGCNLRNPTQYCGDVMARCWRSSALPPQACDCGECTYCPGDNCPECPGSKMHYCCETECEVCCPPPPPDYSDYSESYY